MKLADGTHYNPGGAEACARCGVLPVGGVPDLHRFIPARIRCPRGCFHTREHMDAAAAMTEWNDEQQRIRHLAEREARPRP